MDSALILKIKFDSGEVVSFDHARRYLQSSELLNSLLEDFDTDVLNLLNRLTEIAEIPFTGQIPKVKAWANQLAELSFTGDGFSITGKSDDLLSCYNAMITSVLIRLEFPGTDQIKKGVNWIVSFQHLERGLENKWEGRRILKYGGCLKNTPCYIGVVKSLIALHDYRKSAFYQPDFLVEDKLKQGLDYILDHHVYKRQSNGRPVTGDIEKITYPFSYKTNIIEILRLLKENQRDTDERCSDAKKYLLSRRNKNGKWQINHSYLPKCWVLFDKTREPGLWVSHEIEKLQLWAE